MTAVISAGVTSPDDVAQRRARAVDVERRLCELAAHTHAAMAELARLAAHFNELEGWCGDGLRSFSEWLTISTGFSPRTGDELLRVGASLRALPHIGAAFAAGQLSFDSVRELSRVATPEDEDLWLTVAASASGAQLARICRACRRVLDLETPEHADAQLSRRGVWTHFEDDGMLSLRALLLPEEGALVQAAIEAALRVADAERSAALVAGPAADAPPADAAPAIVEDVPDPADEPWAARRADALIAVCEHVLARGGDALLADPGSLPMLVHVDVGVLTGQDLDGRRHVDGGPMLSVATIRRLGCDASIIAVTERDGLPLNVGRSRRILPRRLRRAVQGRDRTCRFPGCAVPAQRTHAHHIEHWAEGGATDLDNLVSLCHFHHRRLHDGSFAIRAQPDIGVVFERADGRPILRPPHGVDPGSPRADALRGVLSSGGWLHIDADTARARDVTPRLDLGYVVSVVLDGVSRLEPVPA
jgi:Domain of unknown function (DUF222)/HNH endonuclease